MLISWDSLTHDGFPRAYLLGWTLTREEKLFISFTSVVALFTVSRRLSHIDEGSDLLARYE